uniref:US22 family protein n=1 Tax=Cyprinodon variegatus TaxID=28743 RepID=A0A3Q2G573_CYPVA
MYFVAFLPFCEFFNISLLSFYAADPDYLRKLLKFVDDNRDQCFTLKNPPGSILRIARLEDTIYRDQPDVVDDWGMFYLPWEVKMQVIGVVEGISCPSDELVLMTCEDGKLYGYNGEELHLVAQKLEQLRQGKIEYPSTESYYNGQAFEDMVEEKLDQEHKKFVESKKKKFLENLKSQKSK